MYDVDVTCIQPLFSDTRHVVWKKTSGSNKPDLTTVKDRDRHSVGHTTPQQNTPAAAAAAAAAGGHLEAWEGR
jgi:hypothetical protein